MINNKKLMNIVEIKKNEQSDRMNEYIQQYYPEVFANQSLYSKWITDNFDLGIVSDFAFLVYLQIFLKTGQFDKPLVNYPLVDEILLDSRNNMRYKEKADFLIDLLFNNAKLYEKLEYADFEKYKKFVREIKDNNLSNFLKTIPFDEGVKMAIDIIKKIIDENGNLRPMIYTKDIKDGLSSMLLTDNQIEMLEFFAKKSLEEQEEKNKKEEKEKRNNERILPKTQSFDPVSLKKETREFNYNFDQDGNVKPYMYERKVNRLIELMNILGYTETSIQKVLNNVKLSNKKCEEIIKDDLKKDALEEILSENELATLDYVSLVIENDNEMYKGIFESIRKCLIEIDSWLNEYIYLNNESEKQEVREAIIACYEEINDLAYNFYNIHRATLLTR